MRDIPVEKSFFMGDSSSEVILKGMLEVTEKMSSHTSPGPGCIHSWAPKEIKDEIAELLIMVYALLLKLPSVSEDSVVTLSLFLKKRNAEKIIRNYNKEWN